VKFLCIQTGGTIDKDYPKNKNGWAFEIGSPAFISILNKIPTNHSFEIKELFKKDSQEINEIDREKLRDLCIKTNYSKIIISHGTDTLLKTAKHLSKINNKTIIISGSFLPSKFKDSDADFNIGMAVSGLQTLPNGIYIAINGLIAKHDAFIRNLKSDKYELKTT
jgi:L-asparaginase